MKKEYFMILINSKKHFRKMRKNTIILIKIKEKKKNLKLNKKLLFKNLEILSMLA